MTNVCKECPRKGCGSYHDICQDYQREKAENRVKDKKKQAEQEIDAALYQINRAGRNRKNNRRISS